MYLQIIISPYMYMYIHTVEHTSSVIQLTILVTVFNKQGQLGDTQLMGENNIL